MGTGTKLPQQIFKKTPLQGGMKGGKGLPVQQGLGGGLLVGGVKIDDLWQLLVQEALQQVFILLQGIGGFQQGLADAGVVLGLQLRQQVQADAIAQKAAVIVAGIVAEFNLLLRQVIEQFLLAQPQ